MAEAIASGLAKAVLGQLTSSALQQIALWWNLRDDVEELGRTVFTINEVLLDAEEKSVTSRGVKNWLENLTDVLYEADDLLDAFSTVALRQDLMWGNKLTKKVRIFFSSSNQFAYGLKMGRQIKAIKEKLNSLKSQIEVLNLVERIRPAETHFMAKRRMEGHSFVTKGEIIGREDDKNALLELILEESEENLLIIPIVGMGGLGKTALAQLVYNDDSVKNHFELRMWVCVSDVFDVKTIVENIIKSATGNVPDQNLEMDQLQQQLRGKIDAKRYLLVLDDIWNEEREKWFSLKKLLMGGARGSRIIVTTRSQRVAEVTSACRPYDLTGLGDVHAWNLFKEIAFERMPGESINIPTFEEIGKKVLEKCKGVPLVIRTIAGTLSLKRTEKEWLSFKDNELARVSQQEGDILPTLKLSYDHLPSPLKHCFAYCRLYPKDYVIHVEKLIQLWIAQGFVKNSNNLNQSLEDTGMRYFNELVQRSFFQEVEEEYGRMTCKMHDLMHDVAESVAGVGIAIADSNSSGSAVDEKCRHVSIPHSRIPISHEIFLKAKNLRTILLLVGYFRTGNETYISTIASCRCLRALDLSFLNLKKVPTSIHKLKHLRYLDLSFNHDSLKTLPNSICKLQNLQVLKLDHCYRLEKLPEKIGKLVNLTHLGLHSCSVLTHMPRGIGKLVNLTHLGLDCCWWLTHMPRGIGELSSLRRLGRFVVDKDGSHGGADLSELSALNNLRGELAITNLGYVKNAKKMFQAANLKDKAHLQKLILEWSRDEEDDEKSLEWSRDEEDDEKSLEDLQPHPNLKELRVDGWRGDAKFPSWFSSLTNLTHIGIDGPSKFQNLPTFHQLPHLENLQISELSEVEYMEDNLPAQGELFFPSLKSLSLLRCPKLKSWWRNINDEDVGTTTITFPRLSSLHIRDCPLLTSMPLYPSLDDKLILMNSSSRPLLQTMTMSMQMQIQANTTPSSSSSSSSSSLPLSKLKSFQVEKVEVLDSEVHQLKECLQNLTSLQSLTISSWQWIKSSLQHLTGLKELTITKSEEEELELELDGMQSEALRNLSSLRIVHMTGLVSLPSWLQHLIGLEHLYIHICNRLKSLFPVFPHLTSLQRLEISSCEELELCAPDSDTQIFQDFMSLRSLLLDNIPKCRRLPEWLQHLKHLRRLFLFDLPNLTSLPNEMQCLTDLEELVITGVPQLTESYRKGIGADWHKIAHIPSIEIDWERVQ